MRNRVPKASEAAPTPTVRSPTEDQATHCSIYAEGLGQSLAASLVVGSVSVGFYEPRLGDSARFLVVSLTLLALAILPSSLSSAGFPEFCLMFGCGCLHLFPSVTG